MAVFTAAACSGNELRARSSTTHPTATSTVPPESTTAAIRPSGSGQTTAPSSSWRPGRLNWRACDGQPAFQCATLSVPLDWADPSGTKIDLAIGRQPASGKRKGYLLSNPGGPGGSGLDFLFGNPFSTAVLAKFDIVSWDPRGVGASTHLQCGKKVDSFLAADSDPDDATEQRTLDDAARAVADECTASDLSLLAHMGTDDVARDLEAIRVALDDQPLNYVGFSYGTYVGLRYAALFPTRIRAMVLDGVLDPTQRFAEWLAAQTKAIDASVTRAFESCAEATGCPVDDLEKAYDEVRAAVEKAPLPSRSGRRVGPSELATAAIFTSYDKSLWRKLGPAIASALKGDGTGVMDLAQGYYDFGGFTAYAAVECIDSAHPTGSDEYAAFAHRLEQISPRFGGNVANELLPCAYWAVPPQDHTGAVRADGSPAILVLGNRGDAATPYENSVRVAHDLANGHLVSFAGEGHTSYGRNACVTDATDRYLLDLRVPSRDPDCR